MTTAERADGDAFRFQYLEYPASRGKVIIHYVICYATISQGYYLLQIHIKSANPYVEPFFDSGFMNNKADFAPIRWSYKVTREVARRMDGMLAVEFYNSKYFSLEDFFQHSVVNWLLTTPTSTRVLQLLAAISISRPPSRFTRTALPLEFTWVSISITSLHTLAHASKKVPGTVHRNPTMLTRSMKTSSTPRRTTRPSTTGLPTTLRQLGTRSALVR
jgi:hypothetical protein